MDKHEELVSLGLDLYALGANIEVQREALEKMVSDGYAYSSPEVVQANVCFTASCNQFNSLEAQYQKLKAEIEKDGDT